jgi:general secretion pathway protein M
MSALGRWVPERWHQRWMDLSGRERLGLGLALGLLALTLVWSVGVGPAWRQWQQGQAQTQALQTQWQGLQALQAQVSALNGQSRVRPDDAARLLQTSLSTLGTGAMMTVNGDLATVQFKGASAAAVSKWLALARTQAQALPVQARLSRTAATGPNVGSGAANQPSTLGAANAPGTSLAVAPVGALGAPGALSASAMPAGPVTAANASNGLVMWEGQIVLQLPAPAKP